jgi:hypothetical protein
MEAPVKRKLAYLVIGLIVVGVILRLMPHAPNLAPVGAIALFGGALLPRKVAWWLPLAIMVASDALIGFYDGIWFTWLAFLLVGLWGMMLRSTTNPRRIAYGALGSSLIFFAVSNFGTWVMGGLYAHTWNGLVECYTMALPFFRNTLAGDLLYSSALFGAYALAEYAARRQLVQSDVARISE